MARFARALFILLLVAGASSFGAVPLPPLIVRFFDVGQGDAAWVASPEGKTVLIDGGPPEARSALTERVKTLTKRPIDLVILTHPHLDHLGGLAAVLTAFGAQRYLDPGFDHPSTSYLKLLRVVRAKVPHALTVTAESRTAWQTIGLGSGATLTVLWPRSPVEPFLSGTRSDANANSVVSRLSYGKTSFLFAGDAEPNTERRLLAGTADVQSTVLKVGHHGGHYSSTRSFLARVHPRAAVISCGANNEYGHPAPETLGRLRAAGAEVFRTDQDGEIVASSDGEAVTLSATRRASPVRVEP